MKRREFLQKITVSSMVLFLPGLNIKQTGTSDFFPQLGRVAAESISVYSRASELSSIQFQRYLNDVVNIYDSVISEDGPGYNPLWHRVWGGFMHSAYVQPVRNKLNPILEQFPSSGSLMELSVPFSKSYAIRANGRWEESYTLFYGSTHWAFALIEGPGGFPYYEIHNALINASRYVRAEHLRLVSEDELAPIHPEIPPEEKRIEISIDFQVLRAFEYDQLVQEFQVSTGLPSTNFDPDVIPTDTPKGSHQIQTKRPSVHMGDGTLRNDADAYELPGVPWVSYFEPQTGVAIHGAYWHNNFGVTMSHGCVNMRPQDAKWIYRWTTPYPKEDATSRRTQIEVI